MSISSRDMSLRGRIGGFVRASRYSPEELTGPARSGFMKRFEPQDLSLSEEERQRRANCALRAHMAKLARKSAIARRESEINHGK